MCPGLQDKWAVSAKQSWENSLQQKDTVHPASQASGCRVGERTATSNTCWTASRTVQGWTLMRPTGSRCGRAAKANRECHEDGMNQVCWNTEKGGSAPGRGMKADEVLQREWNQPKADWQKSEGEKKGKEEKQVEGDDFRQGKNVRHVLR